MSGSLLFVTFSLALFFGWRKFAHGASYSGNLSPLKRPLVIFDFDGTICPSFDLFIRHLNALAPFYHYKPIEDKEAFRHLSIEEGMRKLGISFYKLPFLIHHIRKNAKQEIIALPPVPGIPELLKTLKNQKIHLAILTSNSKNTVSLYLKTHNLQGIDFVYSGNHIFSKDRHLKNILKKTTLTPNQILFVGDEVRDLEGAKRAGVEALAVSWGYHAPALLQPSICHTPENLCDTILKKTS